MTERLHIEACVVTLPLRLNPVDIANKLSPRAQQALGTFTTAIAVRYNPDVSTATPGVVAIGLTTSPDADQHSISANQPNHIGPVWKPATLILPKDRINLQAWTPTQGPSMYLVGSGLAGKVSITVTLRLTLVASWPLPLPPPDPLEELPKIETEAYVGPVLEGFSLVCCAPSTIQPAWTGTGQVINIDLTRANGYSSTSSYGLRTPNNKAYVAVRYGFGSNFSYRYSSSNANQVWKSNTQVIYGYTTQNAATSAVPVSYYASWRPINGSTSWWCDISPSYTTAVLGGQTITWYSPMCQLILYYFFPETDIFDVAFTPGVKCAPGSILPCPPGDAVANQPQLVPLNMGRNQQMWSRWWKPDFGAATVGQELQYRFTEAKYALTKWPVNCDTTRVRDGEPAPTMDASAKTLDGSTIEEAWLNTDA